jgi:hypothetical protein
LLQRLFFKVFYYLEIIFFFKDLFLILTYQKQFKNTKKNYLKLRKQTFEIRLDRNVKHHAQTALFTGASG